jgi:predicted nucleic acid-binding protein
MKTEPYFIDTNIIMYARGREHPNKAPCASILLKIADGTFEREIGTPTVDSEVFQEIIYRYGMENRWETAVSVSRELLLIGLHVLAVGMSEVHNLIALAQEYSGQGISPRDLVHAAVMISNGIKKIISTDVHFDNIAEVERIDPASFRQYR